MPEPIVIKMFVGELGDMCLGRSPLCNCYYDSITRLYLHICTYTYRLPNV